MIARRLLLPLSSLVTVLVLVTLTFLYQLRGLHQEAQTALAERVAVLRETATLGEEITMLDQQLQQAWLAAAEEYKGALATMPVAVDPVGRLSLLTRRIATVTSTPVVLTLVPQEGSALRTAFEAYRNAALSAFSLGEKGSAALVRQRQQAQLQLTAFYQQQQTIVRRLGQQIESEQRLYDQRVQTMGWWLGAGMVGGLMLVLLAGWWASQSLAQRLLTFRHGLLQLTGSAGSMSALAEIERIEQKEFNECGQLAGAVLDVRQLLEGRRQTRLQAPPAREPGARAPAVVQPAAAPADTDIVGDVVGDGVLYDALTGLPNRRLVLERLQQAIRTSKRHGNGLAVLFLDLDNFRQLNEVHGHAKGDLLLKEVAYRLSQTMRSSDTVGRLEEDEFVVVVEDLPAHPAHAAALAALVSDKVRMALSSSYQLDGLQCEVSVSVGVSLNIEGTPEEIIQAAGAALNAIRRAKAPLSDRPFS